MAVGIVLLNLIYTVCGRHIMWLQSPRVTPWGHFGPKELCPVNSFVTGMRLKMDHEHIGDNTALNAVQLLCTTMFGEDSGNITSAAGRFGDYGNIKYCPSGLATGYQLRSQNGQGNVRDDVAAVDFKLLCTDVNNNRSQAIDDDNKLLRWGFWTRVQLCKSKSAVCGIATQVENFGDNLKNEDETTLNNIDIACCPLSEPFPICRLEYNWKTMMTCSIEANNCEMNLSTGILENEQLSKYREFYDKLGYLEDFDGYVVKALKAKADKYANKTHNKTLKHIISESTMNNKNVSFRVNCAGKMQQIVITCDFIKLFTYKNRCVPDLYAKEWETKALYFRPSSTPETTGLTPEIAMFWSYNCDFIGGDIAGKTSKIVDCADICFSNVECTHFVWSKYNGGTCWMKRFGDSQTPVEIYNESYVCGWIETQIN